MLCCVTDNIMALHDVCAEDNLQGFFFSSNSDRHSLDDLCKEINNNIDSLSKGYLWHKEKFKVFLPLDQQNREDLPFYIASNTSFGDNIEDEWFIVHIILELSRQYNDLVVQIQDSDGDFLLIEAADHLPHWANPETTENRVFICNSHIHLIPPEVASLHEKLTLKNAIRLVTDHQDQTQVSADIENAILHRVGNYPDKIKENTHIAAVKVPLEVATIVKLQPNLIAPIVNTYCHQDVIDSKACKKISFDNWTTVPVKFTKCLYAMLLYSKHKNQQKPVQNDKPTVLGLKLTQGFQIIVNKSSDIYSSKEYSKFLNSLKANGYFQNNIEGSEVYKKRLQNAKDFFSAVECPLISNVAEEITHIMKSDEYLKMKELLQDENTAASALDREDNDDWLTINPEQLNNLLNSRYGKKIKFKKGETVTSHTLTTELNDFLKQTSDYEGIETNNDHHPDNIIDFDSDQFVHCVEKMLNLLSNNKIEETESMDSDFSDGTVSQSEDEEELDKEIKQTLHGEMGNFNNNKAILENLITSLKEEKASAGPSSNLMSSVGLNKTDLLDSDDDCK